MTLPYGKVRSKSLPIPICRGLSFQCGQKARFLPPIGGKTSLVSVLKQVLSLYQLCTAGAAKPIFRSGLSAALGAEPFCTGRNRWLPSWAIDGISLTMPQRCLTTGAINKSVCKPRPKIQLIIHVTHFISAGFANLTVGQSTAPLCPFEAHPHSTFLSFILDTNNLP